MPSRRVVVRAEPGTVLLHVDDCTLLLEPHTIQRLLAALVAARRDAHGLPPGSSWWQPPPASSSTSGSGAMPHNDPDSPEWIPIPLGRREFRRAMENIRRRFDALERTLRIEGEVLVATQADVDALTGAVSDLAAQVSTDDSALNTAVTAIQAEIQELQAAGVDVSGLQAAVSGAQSAVSDLGNAVAGVQALVPPATS